MAIIVWVIIEYRRARAVWAALVGIVTVTMNSGLVRSEEILSGFRRQILEIVSMAELGDPQRRILEAVPVVDRSPNIQERTTFCAGLDSFVEYESVTSLRHLGTGRQCIVPIDLSIAERKSHAIAAGISLPSDRPFNISRREIADVTNTDVRNRRLIADFVADAMNAQRFNGDISSLEDTSVGFGSFPELVSRTYKSESDVGQQPGKDGDEPIWGVIQKGVVPIAFLVSFGVLFWLPDRAAGYGVLLFGLGWVGLIVWYGLLRLE
ncbi:hypothetical protein [Bradyrhizobium elkanii]|uniref:hypothetical protein n=1 Tax=Bradyrhizobium elkanii TaxID=29448 RepID=UPI003D2189DF